jgi:hypothetical protein
MTKTKEDDKSSAPAAAAPPAAPAPPTPPTPAAPSEAAEAEETLPKPVLAAAKALGLKPLHVAAFKERADSITIVTKGGSKLKFPDDTLRQEGKPSKAELLSEPQKDGIPRETGARNVGPLARQ